MSVAEVLARSQGVETIVGRVYGAVVGVVTSIDDPEALGRVKVRYPWLQDDSESPWARLVSFMAGPDRGAVFRPEVDDEVLVVFDQGDMRIPYILGALWNGQDAIPQERGPDGDNNVRLIRSRSGHQILLDDTPGAEKVTILDRCDNRIELSADGVVITSDSIRIGSANCSEGLVLGKALMTLFNAHTHPTGVGPSGPPASPMQEGMHVSSKHRTE